MKLLVINFFPAFYPPRSGGELRAHYLYRAMSERHEITMLTSTDFGARYEEVQHTDKFKEIRFPKDKLWREAYETFDRNKITGELSGLAFMLAVSEKTCALRIAARERAIEADYIVHEFPFSEPIFSDGLFKPEIYNSHNFEASLLPLIAGGAGFASAFHRLYRAEYNLASRVDKIFVTSTDDKRKFELFYGVSSEKIFICPNGVSTEELSEIVIKRKEQASKQKLKPSVLFLGSAHAPNVEAAEFIISSAIGIASANFIIAGGVSSALTYENLPDNVVLIKNFDQKTKMTLLTQADVFINPIVLGSGTSLKALEALISAVPMVSTPEGVRGLDLENNKHALITSRDDFLSSIQSLIEDQNLANKLSNEGRIFVLENYDWKSIAKKFEYEITKPVPSGKNAHLFILALNDYQIRGLKSGGAARVSHLLNNLECNTLLVSLGQRTSIELIDANLLEVTIEKSHLHKSFEFDLNQNQTISANDTCSALQCQSNYLLNVLVSDFARRSQIVIFEHPYLSPLNRLIKSINPKILVVYSSHNHETSLKRSLYRLRADGENLASVVEKIEGTIAKEADLVVCCTDADAHAFGDIPKLTLVVPNGCNSVTSQTGSTFQSNDRIIFGFIGSSHIPNVDAAKYIIEHLAEKFSDVVFELIGSVCEALVNIKVSSNVRLMGIVGEIEKNHIMSRWSLGLNPLESGGGSSLKLPDYMAHGLPTLSTEIGARGFDVEQADAGYVVSLQDFPETIFKFLENRNAWRGMSANARDYADNNLTWKSIGTEYRHHLQKFVKQINELDHDALLIVTYRYSEPPLGGAEEYLIEVIKRLRPFFAWIDLAAVNSFSITNKFHFSTSVKDHKCGSSCRIGEHFDQQFYFSSTFLSEEEVFQKCKLLEKNWKQEEFELYIPFIHLALQRADCFPLSGMYDVDYDNNLVRRWTSPNFSFVLPRNISIFHIAGYASTSKSLTYTLYSFSAGSLIQVGAPTQLSIMTWFDVAIKFTEVSHDSPLIIVFDVDEHVCAGDHRPLGLFLERSSYSVDNIDAEDLIRYEIEMAYNIEFDIRINCFSLWVEELIALAKRREENYNKLFRDVRGPHSKELTDWLILNHHNYSCIIIQGYPFDTIPSSVDAIYNSSMKNKILTLPHYHADDRFYYWNDIFDSFNRADVNFVFTKSVAERFEKFATMKLVGGGGIDIAETSTSRMELEFSKIFKKQIPFFLVLGRKTHSKGYNRVLNAFKNMSEAEKNFEIVMIGPDEDGDVVDVPGVTYFGQQSRDIVKGALSSCCGLVSMSQSESFGIVLCEAWLHSKPVIGSNLCYSYRDMIRHGENGFLVDTDLELVNCMRILATDKQTRDKMGNNGFLEVIQKYSWNSIGEMFLSTLRE